MTASPQLLAPRLKTAVAAWTSPNQAVDFRLNWSGAGDGTQESKACVTLIRYAQAINCVEDGELGAALTTLNGHNHEWSALWLWGYDENWNPERAARERLTGTVWNRLSPEEKQIAIGREEARAKQQIDQAAQLMRGLVSAVETAVAFCANRRSVDSQAAQKLSAAASAYSAAWPLCNEVVLPGQNHFEGLYAGGQMPASIRLLTEGAAHAAFRNQDQLTVSTWLILRRLFAELLGEAPPEPFPNRLLMLLYGSDKRGHVGPLTIEAAPEGQWGFYPDPLAFGLTVIDQSMLDSLKRAWRISRQSLLARSGPKDAAPRALRLVPEFPQWVQTLEGGSAGGLFACGMYATSLGKSLDPHRTASCALQLEGVDRDSDGALQPEDVLLKEVRELDKKLAAAEACSRPKIEVVAVQEQQANELLEHRSRNRQPQVVPVSDLWQLFQALRGDADCEDLLAQHAKHVAGEWDCMKNAGPDDPLSLRDENETHRFDCYVPPTYYVERPRQQGPVDRSGVQEEFAPHELEANRGDRADDDHAPVPGKGAESLLNLLGLTRAAQAWDAAPEWLRTEQQRGARCLVVYDNAGSGKTVFSYRLKQVAAGADAQASLFGRRAPLVVRWEGHWPRDKDKKLLPLARALEMQLCRDLEWKGPEHAQTATDCVQYAISERRVVIILDGFDQFQPDDRAHVASLLKSGPAGDRDAVDACQWIITSRVHTIDELRNDLFDDRRFARVRIDPFTPEQQDDYFDLRVRKSTGKPVGPDWRQVIGVHESDDEQTVQAIREGMDDFLRLPMTLWLIGKLIDLSDEEKRPPPRFQTLSELALAVSRRLLQRAIDTSSKAIDQELRRQKVPPISLDAAGQLTLLERVVTLIAFQLMLEENYNGQVDGGSALEAFETRCRDRWFHELDLAESAENLTERRRRDLAKASALADDHWRWALVVLKTIELNHRSTTEAYQPKRLAFRSRKVLECHAARYLTRYATDWDIFGNDDPRGPGESLETRCAWDFTNDLEWENCWLLAIDMPRFPRPSDPEEAIKEEVTLRSLSALFRLPKQRTRPTLLIYRAWHLFELDRRLLRERRFEHRGRLVLGKELEPNELARRGKSLVLAGANEVLDAYRQSSRGLVAQFRTLDDLPPSTAEQAAAAPADKSRWLVSCPPRQWIAEFERGQRLRDPRIGVMGAADGEGDWQDERPRHLVRLERFLIQATPVTRAQYRQFDPAFEKRYEDEFARYSSAPPDGPLAKFADGDFPVIETRWYDGFAYAKWLGPDFGLPSECQRELAARAGTETAFHFGDQLDGHKANCNGEHPWPEDKFSEDHKGPYIKRATPVGHYPPNAWGVYDGSGNVWNWCWDLYDEQTYERRTNGARFGELPDRRAVFADDDGPPAGSSGRVLRGGSWGVVAIVCRSAFRGRDVPDGRDGSVGLRVVRFA